MKESVPYENKVLLVVLTAFGATLVLMLAGGLYIAGLLLYRNVIKVPETTPPAAQGPYCRPGVH